MRIYFWLILNFFAGVLSAQRCGYDYLQAFVVKVVEGKDTVNIERLKLTLVSSVGVPLKESEFWANEVGRRTGLKAVDQFYRLPIKGNLYVLFFDSRNYNHKKLPQWFIKVEAMKNNRNLPENFTKLFPIDASKGDFLCGHTGPYKIVTLNLLDTFKKFNFDLHYDIRQSDDYGNVRSELPKKVEEPMVTQPVKRYPRVNVLQKPTQWVEMKGKDYVFRDSLRVYNRGSERVRLPKLESLKPAYEELLEFRKVSGPDELSAGDSGWIVVELGVSKLYTGNVYRLPFEEKYLEFKYDFGDGFSVRAGAKYWVVDGNLLVNKEPRYEFMTTPQNWFWVIEKDVNYGKCLRLNDTLLKIGHWHYAEGHKDIIYSKNYQFQVLSGGNVVNNAEIWALKKGVKKRLFYTESSGFHVVWLSPDVDTLMFKSGELSNYLFDFNRDMSMSMFMVELMEMGKTNYFLKQYPQFKTYQGYRFVDTLFLVKLAAVGQSERTQRIQRMQKKGNLFQQAGFDDAYFTLMVNQSQKDQIYLEMRNWLAKGWIESAHQAVEFDSPRYQAVTYLSGEMTVKPKNYQWLPEYGELARKYGMSLSHSFGDGTFGLKSDERIIDSLVFFNQLILSDDSRWQYSNPSFFTPHRVEVGGYKE